MRKHIVQEAKSKFFTYTKQHLRLAFPLVNEADIDSKAKIDNETRWKTRDGFRDLRKLNLNEHPKKPPTSVIDNIRQNPYYEQNEHTNQMLTKQVYNPAVDGKPDFNK